MPVCLLPHVILNCNEEWDPTKLDNDIGDEDDDWYNALDIMDEFIKDPFDELGNYKHCHINELHFFNAESEKLDDNKLIDDMIK